MKVSNDGYYLEFETGRKVSNGLISVSGAPGWQLFEGYDAELLPQTEEGTEWDGEFTAAEKAELADFMIDLWRQFKREAVTTTR